MHAQTKTDTSSIGGSESRDHQRENLRRLHNDLVDAIQALPLRGEKDVQIMTFLDYASVWVQRAFYII